MNALKVSLMILALSWGIYSAAMPVIKQGFPIHLDRDLYQYGAPEFGDPGAGVTPLYQLIFENDLGGGETIADKVNAKISLGPAPGGGDIDYSIESPQPMTPDNPFNGISPGVQLNNADESGVAIVRDNLITNGDIYPRLSDFTLEMWLHPEKILTDGNYGTIHQAWGGGGYAGRTDEVTLELHRVDADGLTLYQFHFLVRESGTLATGKTESLFENEIFNEGAPIKVRCFVDRDNANGFFIYVSGIDKTDIAASGDPTTVSGSIENLDQIHFGGDGSETGSNSYNGWIGESRLSLGNANSGGPNGG
jgi:hypothetical protein